MIHILSPRSLKAFPTVETDLTCLIPPSCLLRLLSVSIAQTYHGAATSLRRLLLEVCQGICSVVWISLTLSVSTFRVWLALNYLENRRDRDTPSVKNQLIGAGARERMQEVIACYRMALRDLTLHSQCDADDWNDAANEQLRSEEALATIRRQQLEAQNLWLSLKLNTSRKLRIHYRKSTKSGRILRRSLSAR